MFVGADVGRAVEDDEHFVQRAVAVAVGAEPDALAHGQADSAAQQVDVLTADPDDGVVGDQDLIVYGARRHRRIFSRPG